MRRQTVITRKKKRGPAPTGKGELVGVRLHQPLLGGIDDWRGRQDGNLSRPEAIRSLVEIALGVIYRWEAK
jgi:hypothetical protein